jgi:hypothetical protein
VRPGHFPFDKAVTLALAVGTAGAGSTGCGRRATHADCQLIVDRSVELRLKGQDETDPKVVAKREAQVRAELDDKISSCESRRVTDKMMACVKSATSSEELETCLR